MGVYIARNVYFNNFAKKNSPLFFIIKGYSLRHALRFV
nr:MAG TPA: hypothetical protein [Caudoviricetes sp.]